MRGLALVGFLLLPVNALAYSVLTHEAIVDVAWDQSIRPLLVRRFPQATAEELRQAHGYAYGGAIIQDAGYFPFGSRVFSDLVHYVRSGDFIVNLLRESQTLDEYAFALGSLAHYVADGEAHSIAVNPAVAELYPKLRRKYGSSVTYEQGPSAHLKTEFAFDVSQVAQNHYAPEAYHNFIGFGVAKPVLERAFRRTYALELDDVFGSVDLALGTYRWTISSLLPQMTRVAWATKKDELTRAQPGLTRQRFLYNLSRASYEKEWGRTYKRPGWFSRFLAFLFRLFPRFGPLSSFGFHPLTPDMQTLFLKSFNLTVDRYRTRLSGLNPNELHLADYNFDTGGPSQRGTYHLADKAYAKLLNKLADRQFHNVPADLRLNLLQYYAKGTSEPKLKPKDQARLARQVRQLQELAPDAVPIPATSR